MVKYRDRLLVVLALVSLLLSCTPYDIDRIVCGGHGQCPTGWHCDLEPDQSLGETAVCVPGEATSAGVGVSVQKIHIPAMGVSVGLMGALHTFRSGFAGVQEAINEDVLGFPLLSGAQTRDDGSASSRVRPGGESLYSPEERQYVPKAERPVVQLIAPSLAARSPADIGVGVEPTSTISLGHWNCGGGDELFLDNSVETFSAGSTWQAGSVFEEPSLVDGPRMPVLPNPEGPNMTAGRVLILPGETLRLQAPNRSLDPLAQDVVLALGSNFNRSNRPDCGETICNDQIDNDGDGKVDCMDADCEGRPGPPGSELICRESTCWDGIDNDGNGLVDCEDTESDCRDSDCVGPERGNIAAFPVSEDGSVEISWEELSSSLQFDAFSAEQDLSFMLAWGRTRSRIALDTERGVQSALLSSSQWLVAQTIVLESGQYLLDVDPQREKELPGRVFSVQLGQVGPVAGEAQWSDESGYQVFAVDRFERATIGYQNPLEDYWVTPVDNVIRDVEVDLSDLCRGPAAILVAHCDLYSGADQECTFSGVGTIDNRHPQLHCDNVFPSEEHEAMVRPWQVTCSSFSERPEGVDPTVHRYFFEAVAGTKYQIDVLATQLAMDGDMDVEMVLRNQSGVEQPFQGYGSAQDYCNSDPRMVWECGQTGVYELEVWQGDDENDSGPYKLLIEPL